MLLKLLLLAATMLPALMLIKLVRRLLLESAQAPNGKTNIALVMVSYKYTAYGWTSGFL